MERPTRREILRGAPAVLGALAGCEGLTGRESRTTTTTGTATDTTTSAPLRRLELRNETGAAQYVSVAVSDGAGVLSSSTVAVPEGTSRTLSLPTPTGVLSVELETTAGLADTHPWVVGDAFDELVVTLTSGGFEFAQSAWCDPDCTPVSKGGTAADFPYYGGPVFQTSYYGANVVVENTADRTLATTVRITHDGASILDYRYEVPPGVTLEFPGVHSAGKYTVSVETDAGTTSYEWRPPKERRLQVRLAETGVDVSCGTTSPTFILANNDDVPHRLHVTAARPGSDRLVLDKSFIVQPGARYREQTFFSGSGQYDLQVATAEGERTTYDWWLCPPRGPTEIAVEANGTIHVVQYQPGA